ncbi:hypothetical protein EXU48_11460 [Occultella glacieicola]|uniref:HPr kinase n=1 Tax=Occultella glacieicola TaxID=2518684 RepID=A0ABY2E4M6_9MICO|nr:hypothetical protein [Occultella glacieicola]TDE94065.1 hypothetical protein EXU48_11460 [Occultella glacieicola]
MNTTKLYGLNLDSEIALHQTRPADGPTDVTIRVGAPMGTTEAAPPGRMLLHLDGDKQYYSATETDSGYLLRFYRTCDFVIDPGLTTVTAHLVHGADPERVGVLAAGTMLSFLLALRRRPVLHASAVQVGEAALAFVGRSGMGKSTMATLMAADGARLITDDVLHLDLDTVPPRCHLGATELRLRKAAGDLAARFAVAPGRRLTGDDRDALAIRSADTDLLPLHAIVIPAPDHSEQDREPEFLRLSPRDALLHLLMFPRIVGWQDPAAVDLQFQHLSDVVEKVPVYVARLPWGPPFPPAIAAQVLTAVGLDQAVTADSTASR